MIFFVYNNLLITSKTVVFLTFYTLLSIVKGVYPVIKKWHLGVGTKLANKPTKSLFIYPGYLKVVVEAAITVEIKALLSYTVGDYIFNLSVAILFKAELSKTTVVSAFKIILFKVKIEL